jgi:PAS domain S-box-containing protein
MHFIYLLIGLGFVIIVSIAILLFFYYQKNNKNRSLEIGDMSLRDQTNKLSFIFNSINEGLILINEAGTITLINPAASKLTGWDIKDALGINVNMVAPLANDKGEIYPDRNNPFMRVFKVNQSIKDNQAYLVTKTKSQISVDINVSPVQDNNNNISAIIIIRNVTAERQEEERLADFISTASHEMRTPVAAIEGYLELALSNKVSIIDDNVRGYLEKAQIATQHLGQLFQDLLTSAKAEDGRLTNHPQVIEIGSFLNQLSDDLKFSAAKKRLRFSFQFGSNQLISKEIEGQKQINPLYYIYADPDRLREVITNLFDNALKYTEEGSITIGLTANNQIVQISVQDTGIGIPAEDIEHLFQKFYRVDNSETRTVGGTGLGLFISRKIIELYNGRIWVKSELGKGSTFYISLPRIPTTQANTLR